MCPSEYSSWAWPAILGWLFAALTATVVVPMLGFVSVGAIGAATWYLSFRAALEEQRAEGRTNSGVPTADRRSLVGGPTQSEIEIEQSQHAVATEMLRFLGHFGIGLASIGLTGFAINHV